MIPADRNRLLLYQKAVYMRLYITFSEELNFFLHKDRQNAVIKLDLNRRASVKDIIESIGIPHTEVGKILFKGEKVSFSFIPLESGRLDVESVKTPCDISDPGYLREAPYGCIRFVADVNVMKLGKLLLFLGFDVAISSTFTDSWVARIAFEEKRVVLTRDTDLLKRNKIVHARRLREDRPFEQLRETLDFFGLTGPFLFFSRCTDCNRALVKIQKEKIINELEPKTKMYYNDFYICPGCGKIFWKGSHYYHMKKRIENEGICDLTGRDHG